MRHIREWKLAAAAIAAAMAFCILPDASGSGLDGFCGYKVWELRKDGKVGDTKPVYAQNIKSSGPFRKFTTADLEYNAEGRLCEVRARGDLANMSVSSVKKEFEKCVKHLCGRGLRECERVGVDGASLLWTGKGSANTRDGRFEVNVWFAAQFVPNKLYKDDDRMRGVKTLWQMSMYITWKLAGEPDLVPDKSARKASMPLKRYVEQSFHASFGAACPSLMYESSMKLKEEFIKHGYFKQGHSAVTEEEFSRILESKLGETEPYLNVSRRSSHPFALPGARFAYGRHMTIPVCACSKVLFAYANPGDKPDAPAPVGKGEDLALGAVVLWGRKDVKNGDKAMHAFFDGVGAKLGISFAETNTARKAVAVVFRDGDFTATAVAKQDTETRVSYIDASGKPLDGARLEDFNKDYGRKVLVEFELMRNQLEKNEIVAKKDELEKKFLKERGVAKETRQVEVLKYYVIFSDSLHPEMKP